MRLKTESSHYHSFRPLKLYREELEEVFELVKNTCTSVEVSDEKRVYDSLEELGDRVGKKLRDLQIRGHDPYITVQLGAETLKWGLRKDYNRIFTTDGEKAETLFFKVRDLLSKI